MTYHDKISAFIDNELSHDAEQDFLISLASNESVRRAFRSELVMKNVIHQDELTTQPKREMRGVLLGALGIGTTVATQEATAAAPSLWHTLFASKMNALFVAGLVSVSAVTGYLTHAILAPATPQVITRTVIQPSEAPREVDQAPAVIQPAAEQAIVTETPRKAKVAKRPTAKQSEPASATEPTTTGGVGASSVTFESK